MGVFNRVEQEANWQLPHLNPGILSLADFKTSRFNITFRNCEELDGWHAVFGKVVYGFDVLKAISDEGNTDGAPKQPVVVAARGRVDVVGARGRLQPRRAGGELAAAAPQPGDPLARRLQDVALQHHVP